MTQDVGTREAMGGKSTPARHDVQPHVTDAVCSTGWSSGASPFTTTRGTFDLVFDQAETWCRNLWLLFEGGVTASLVKQSPHRQGFEAKAKEIWSGLIAAGQNPGAVLAAIRENVEKKGWYQVALESFRDMGEPMDRFKRDLSSKDATSLTLAMLAVGVLANGPLFGGGKLGALGKVPHGNPSRLGTIAAKSQPFTGDPGEKLGGGMLRSGLVEIDRELSRRYQIEVTSSKLNYIRTADLTEADLGYPGGLRDPVDVDLTKIPTAPVKQILNVTPVSEVNSGTSGLIRLGELDDGTPVALKKYYSIDGPATDAIRIAKETRSAKLFSDLGIGPRFHGTFLDSDGKVNIVMDIVRGEYPAAARNSINRQTFADLDTMLQRLHGAGIDELNDLQYLVDETGRVLAIDASAIVDNIGMKPAALPDGPRGDFTNERYRLLQHADPQLAAQYVADLKRSNPDAHEGLEQYYQNLRKPLPG